MNLSTPVSQLSKVGKSTAKRLHGLGVRTVRDLLYWFPFRYEDYRKVVLAKELVPGELATVRVKIELLGSKRSWKKHKMITEALVADASGSVRVVWFNQPFVAKILKPGDEVFLSGKVSSDMLGAQLVNPLFEKVKPPPSPLLHKEGADAAHTARLVPIYSTTAGLTQKQIRSLVNQIMTSEVSVPEWLPEEILEHVDLVPLADAIRGIHLPVDDVDLKKSTERLKFDELFLVQLQSAQARAARTSSQAAALTFQEEKIKEFVASLPFTLTKTQKVSAWEIFQDIAKPIPMNRLLSGDVGSGKTVVAAMAMYDAFLNGAQSVLMAPTEILAKQHFDTIVGLLGKYGIEIALFSRSHKQIFSQNNTGESTKSDLIKNIKSGQTKIIIGTHALLSENVEFKKMVLVIVDEQHRFGVAQRKLIKEKGAHAHFLSMTATPIPRSLALTIYGDLDLSIISEMPLGRKPIISRLVDPINRQKAYDFIRAQVRGGRQVFVICPLIEDDGEVLINLAASEKKSVMGEYEKLSKKIFPDLRVGFLHGKLKSEEKDAVMAQFKKGELDVLVSTSVVEVGVDIPNASVMMIEGADRFGLAQLHQFRGRVGRSVYQSYCLLFTDSSSQKVAERLKFFEKNNDGFKLAEKDLELRGPGEVYGVEQSGEMQLHLAKLTDHDLIKKARDSAQMIVDRVDSFPRILQKIEEWRGSVHLE